MDWTGKKALVTGGAGFVPSHVVDALVARGAAVTVLDNLQAGLRENVADGVTLLESDVRDREAVAAAVAGQDYVFHLAANASVPASVRDPRYDFESNSLGSFNVYEAALAHGVQRVIYASSAAVYGVPQYVPTPEEHPLVPVSFYGLSKLSGERLGLMYHQMFELGFTAIRIFNTYGPRQPRYVLADLVRKLMRDSERLEVLGTGEQIRDYAYATDTAGAFVAAAENEEMNGGVFNIAGGNPVSIKELVAIILEVMELPDCEIHYTGQSWPGDIPHLEADIGKIRGHGFTPRVELAEGIRRTIESDTIVGEPEF
jgi:UDP-glucose 4-epimerase